MDVGKDYLMNYAHFSKTNHKLNVALMSHQEITGKGFFAIRACGYLLEAIVEAFCE